MKKTDCPKIGIKIHPSNNDYKENPFENKSQNTNLENKVLDSNNFDLNIDNYSMKDIFHLFNIQNEILNENIMKESKKFVLKTHPDKSGLNQKYFLESK